MPWHGFGLVLAGVLVLSAATTASAATISYDNSQEEFVLVAGDVDNTLTIDPLEQAVQLTLTGEPIEVKTSPGFPAHTCTNDDAHSVICSSPTYFYSVCWSCSNPWWPSGYSGYGGVTRLKVSTGGGNDTVQDSPGACAYKHDWIRRDHPICHETDLELTVLSGGGNDTVETWTAWWSWLDGGPGADKLITHRGNGDNCRYDRAGLCEPSISDGGDGNDRISAEDVSAIKLWGGAGADQLIGGNGHDYLNGGPGIDAYFGGPGSDRIAALHKDPSEVVDCGESNYDRAYVDRNDKPTAACEDLRYAY